MTARGSRGLAAIDASDVRQAYRRWAPVYDRTFGKFVEAAVRSVTARANCFSGRLIEVGVGTGLALPHYGPQLRVTGIDLSPDMLARARERVSREGQSNVEALLEMDATAIDFADQSFDVATAMFVMTVVPDPVKVMRELARVTKPGGTVLICNHFSVEEGLRGALERSLSRYAARLGWRPEFPVQAILVCEELELVSRTPVKPFGFFTLLEFRKRR
ncbi:class I SAM-dependent methyltransferase [Aestuariivirga sp.]|uniref:class I SAM-dependent methyltransferase n=1 Tax=Aestuariivirga sp. TaxID=2650926 RepID=UPI00391B4A08